MILIIFSPQKFVLDKWVILGPKMAHLHNSGLAGRIFIKFCRMKGDTRYMKMLLVVFGEKNHLGEFDLFRPVFSVSLVTIEIESSHFYYWILKHSGHDFFHDWYWILKQDMIRVLKHSKHDFSGKQLCGNTWFCRACLRICCVSFFNVKVLEC